MQLLTFNSHQSYVFNLAKVGGRLDVVHQIEGNGHMQWNPKERPLPENATLVGLEKATRLLRDGKYDLAICHNISDLISLKGADIPKVLCIHGTVKGRIATERSSLTESQWNQMVAAYLNTLDDVHVVFVSEKKKQGRGLEGTVISTGIDPDEYDGYTGEDSAALTVANQFLMRGKILGYAYHRKIVGSHPCRIVGDNPGLPNALSAENWETLKDLYRTHRVYVYTAVSQYEDGYNMAMLEAMCTGMPVVSIENDTSPIIDGVNGFISSDPSILAKRLKELLMDHEMATAMGAAARQTVKSFFGMERFIHCWRRLIAGIMTHQEVYNESQFAAQR